MKEEKQSRGEKSESRFNWDIYPGQEDGKYYWDIPVQETWGYICSSLQLLFQFQGQGNQKKGHI